jgi:hypothetical protein
MAIPFLGMSRSAQRNVVGRLAILIPTYRFDRRARHTIASLAALASDDIAVIIGDNSENPEKWKFLRILERLHSNVHVHCHKMNIGASGNWMFLFDRATLPYYLFVGDDDFCTPAYVECSLRLMESHSDAAAAAGHFAMISSGSDMLPANGARLESDALDRCTNFVVGGGNSLPNSMANRSMVQSFIDYVRHHPLKASFFDWMMAYTLLAKGKYYAEREGLYLYDVSNWETGEACWANDAKSYVDAGLPQEFAWFHQLYWAVELVHFFSGRFSPLLDGEQRARCAQRLHEDRMRDFRRRCDDTDFVRMLEGLLARSPGAKPALHALLGNHDATHPSLFEWFARIVGAFDSNCEIAYLDFVRGSVEQGSAKRVPTS